jgi:hypothetical protein
MPMDAKIQLPPRRDGGEATISRVRSGSHRTILSAICNNVQDARSGSALDFLGRRVGGFSLARDS